MKKVALLAVCVFAFSISAISQFSFGPRAGINLTQQRFTSEYKVFRQGFVGGVMLKYEVNDLFSIQPELLFSQKGVHTDEDGDDFHDKLLNYIELPVMGKFIAGKDFFNFYINAGPYTAFLVSGKTSYSKTVVQGGADVVLSDESPIDFSEDTKQNRIDFGLSLGLGFEFEVGRNGRIITDLRWDIGFPETYEDVDPAFPSIFISQEETMNRALGITVGYIFGSND